MRAVITKGFCHAADLLASKEGQAALKKLNNFGNILLCEHSEISLMKKPIEQQQTTSSIFVVDPADQVAYAFFILHIPSWITPQYHKIPKNISRT